MKKFLFATTCLTLSSAAMAADLPMQTKAPVYAPPPFTWTGFYVGALIGGGTISDPGGGNSEGYYRTSTGSGVGAIAGGQFGYNYQEGNWVFGVEGEGYWSNIKNSLDYSSVSSTTGAVFDVYNTSLQNRYDYTVAGRVGLAFDRTLIYAKGGWAWGNYKYNDSYKEVGSTYSYFDNGSVNLNGPMFGVGIEHALTRNWTVKFEYDFIAYGSSQLHTTGCTVNGTTSCYFNDGYPAASNKQVFKFGANYLFDPFGAAPLLAKY